MLQAFQGFDVPLAIMPLKISDDNGSVTLWDMFCAMSFAVTHGAEIVNISAGWYGGPNPIMKKLIERHPDVIFVCSAGNEGVNTDFIENGHWPSGYTFFPNVISAAALNEDRTDLAYFSNYGTNSISLAAPGEEVTTITPCDGQLCDEPLLDVSGTSFATPYLSAIAAAMLHCTEIEPTQIRFRMYDFGMPLPALAGNVQSGKLISI